ncbi:hypothetical protein CDAR_200821 [Caerostris darwini]|uniref:Uncharacterized protein n=1 Tax=Caerostris darwini TaxID=1538125 RepID=A0AAV4Q7C3_9ARAC|nr:hypothetical protein CDAR_200821 [Caerostris darwini]
MRGRRVRAQVHAASVLSEIQLPFPFTAPTRPLPDPPRRTSAPLWTPSTTLLIGLQLEKGVHTSLRILFWTKTGLHVVQPTQTFYTYSDIRQSD